MLSQEVSFDQGTLSGKDIRRQPRRGYIATKLQGGEGGVFVSKVLGKPVCLCRAEIFQILGVFVLDRTSIAQYRFEPAESRVFDLIMSFRIKCSSPDLRFGFFVGVWGSVLEIASSREDAHGVGGSHAPSPRHSGPSKTRLISPAFADTKPHGYEVRNCVSASF